MLDTEKTLTVNGTARTYQVILFDKMQTQSACTSVLPAGIKASTLKIDHTKDEAKNTARHLVQIVDNIQYGDPAEDGIVIINVTITTPLDAAQAFPTTLVDGLVAWLQTEGLLGRILHFES